MNTATATIIATALLARAEAILARVYGLRLGLDATEARSRVRQDRRHLARAFEVGDLDAVARWAPRLSASVACLGGMVGCQVTGRDLVLDATDVVLANRAAGTTVWATEIADALGCDIGIALDGFERAALITVVDVEAREVSLSGGGLGGQQALALFPKAPGTLFG